MTSSITIRLDSMGRWSDVMDVIRAAGQAHRDGRPLVLDVRQTQSIWPNACVPIAAVVQHFRALDCQIAVVGESAHLSASSFRNPIAATEENLRARRLMNTVWVYFNEQEAINLTNALVRMLQRTVELEDGVLEALNLCLFEVLDNVFQHSEAGGGFLMAVLTQQGRRLALAVADTGIGVRNSFSGSTYNPPTHFDALTLAIQAGVTRTGDKRGNGLYALRGTVEQNRGSLTLHSGPGVLRISGGAATGKDYSSTPIIGPANHGLFVDWQIDLGAPVSLRDVLGIEWASQQLESLENAQGDHQVMICEHDAGTGTRKAAEQLRLYLVNLLHQGAPRLVLNFDGVVVVSASFADEVIGKLAAEFGPVRFFSTFLLRNMTPTIEGLLDRAIRLRIGTEPPAPVTR